MDYDLETYERPISPLGYVFLIFGIVFMLQGWALLVVVEIKSRTRSLIHQAASGNVKKHDPREPYDDMNFELVHCVGKARNDELLTDHDFGVEVADSYRLYRAVEMYQVHEERKTRTRGSGKNKRTEVYYVYTNGWYGYRIDSSHFNHADKRGSNPSNRWPFEGDVFSAKRLDMENMKLDLDRALQKLGTKG